MSNDHNQAIAEAMDSLLLAAAHIAASLSLSEQKELFSSLHSLEEALTNAGVYAELSIVTTHLPKQQQT